MKLEVGTLQELNVKPGDVVGSASKPEAGTFRIIESDMTRLDKFTCADYRIISRASTTQSHVRTVTRKEIVPGVYGPLNVIASIGGLVSMQIVKEFMTKGEVDELLDNLTAIKEAME